MADTTTTTRHLEPGLDDPEVAAAFERWKAARKALMEAALPLAALTDEALNLHHYDDVPRWRDGHQRKDGGLDADREVLDRYREARARCTRANEALSKLSGLVR